MCNRMFIREKIKEGDRHEELIQFSWDELSDFSTSSDYSVYEGLLFDEKRSILENLIYIIRNDQIKETNNEAALAKIGLKKYGNRYIFINFIPTSIIPFYLVEDHESLHNYYLTSTDFSGSALFRIVYLSNLLIKQLANVSKVHKSSYIEWETCMKQWNVKGRFDWLQLDKVQDSISKKNKHSKFMIYRFLYLIREEIEVVSTDQRKSMIITFIRPPASF